MRLWIGLLVTVACRPPSTSDPHRGGDIELDCDAQSWFVDEDGDGYGVAVESCEEPANRVDQGGDCDDADPDRSPGAGEPCDGIDNDCDGVIDLRSVPHAFRTIQAAVDATPDGETLCLDAIEHRDPFDLTGRQLELLGVNGATLELSDLVAGPLITAGPRTDVTLRNLRIAGLDLGAKAPGQSVQGAIVQLRSGRLTLDQVELVSHHVALGDDDTVFQGLLHTSGESELTLRDCTVRGVEIEVVPTGGGHALVQGVVVHAEAGRVVLDHVVVEELTLRTREAVGGITSMALLLYAHRAAPTSITDLTVSDVVIEASATEYADLWPSVLHLSGDTEGSDLLFSEVHVSATAPIASTGEVVTLWGEATIDGLTIRDSSITSVGTRSPTRGDALLSSTWGPVTVDHYTAVGNRIEVYGGFTRGVLEDEGGGSYRWLDVRDNHVVGDWAYKGLVDLWHGGNIEHAVVAGNSVEATDKRPLQGGIVGLWSAELHHADIVGNEVHGVEVQGGGLAMGGDSVVRNVSVAFNDATASTTDSAGVYLSDGSTLDWAYNNVYANTGGPQVAGFDPSDGTGNLAADPAYVDRSSLDPTTWDLTLLPASLLVGAGDPSLRDADGSTCDIGAYGGPGGAW